MIKPIYLDYNATTPHDPEVVAAMLPFFEEIFGNPSSSHWYGIPAKRAVENARKQVASLLGCDPHEVIFTSGGTESNNHAIHGIVREYRDRGSHIITTEIEHYAVLEVCRFLEKDGISVTYLPVDESGCVRVSDVEKAIRRETILITVMHANNEVGTIQPVEDIARLAKSRDIIVHSDAAQSVGKIPVNVRQMGCDLLSLAGHKLYAPKGVGALFIRKGLTLGKFMHGAGQERGCRAGTENVQQIAGLGKACEIAERDLEKNMRHTQEMRDMLEAGLSKEIPNIRINGHPEKRLPNTLSVSFPRLEANRILEKVGLDIAASAGAACHADTVRISHVLKAMNVPFDYAKGTLRLSVGKITTRTEIGTAIRVISDVVKNLS